MVTHAHMVKDCADLVGILQVVLSLRKAVHSEFVDRSLISNALPAKRHVLPAKRHAC